MKNSSMSAIREEGFRLLVDGLGTAGAVTFLRQFENGYGNYTQEREKLLSGLSIDDIVARIESRKAQKS